MLWFLLIVLRRHQSSFPLLVFFFNLKFLKKFDSVCNYFPLIFACMMFGCSNIWISISGLIVSRKVNFLPFWAWKYHLEFFISCSFKSIRMNEFQTFGVCEESSSNGNFSEKKTLNVYCKKNFNFIHQGVSVLHKMWKFERLSNLLPSDTFFITFLCQTIHLEKYSFLQDQAHGRWIAFKSWFRASHSVQTKSDAFRLC